MRLKSVSLFCGAGPCARPIYHEAAARLGRHIAERGLSLVCGGCAGGLRGGVGGWGIRRAGVFFVVTGRGDYSAARRGCLVWPA